MKHQFLLDENILHHAIKGVDARNSPDLTATKLALLIAQNCHKIVMNKELWNRYWQHLPDLLRPRPSALEPLFLLNQLVKNSAKLIWDSPQAPELPQGITVPPEDIPIVRIALISRPKVVTADGDLREAINSQPSLGLTALTPAEAIELAKDQ